MSTIRFATTSAHLEEKAPGTIICGMPGSGKTFAMLVMAANALIMNERVIVIDPKNDFTRLYNVNKNIEIIDVNNIRPGALNPFEFLKRKDRNGTVTYVDSSTIMSILQILCGKFSDEQFNAVFPVVKDLLIESKRDGKYVDFQKLADALYSMDDQSAIAVGNQLYNYYDGEFAKLIFTRDENVRPLVLSDDMSMVISLHGMTLPEYNKRPEDYDSNDRFTAAVVFIIATKLLQILNKRPEWDKRPVTFFCDEAHLLFSNPMMSSVINKFLSVGRSLNTATVLASQGISKFPDDIAQYISSKFIFQSATSEAERFLKIFDTSEYDPANAIAKDIIGQIAKYPKGRCFFIDKYNRNGVIDIVSPFDPKLFSSNPLEKIDVKINYEETEE